MKKFYLGEDIMEELKGKSLEELLDKLIFLTGRNDEVVIGIKEEILRRVNFSLEKYVGEKFVTSYPNGWFSKEYDTNGATIIGAGKDWMEIITLDGTRYYEKFDEGWLPGIEDYILKWIGAEIDYDSIS
jgi:hypothetical protein